MYGEPFNIKILWSITGGLSNETPVLWNKFFYINFSQINGFIRKLKLLGKIRRQSEGQKERKGKKERKKNYTRVFQFNWRFYWGRRGLKFLLLVVPFASFCVSLYVKTTYYNLSNLRTFNTYIDVYV